MKEDEKDVTIKIDNAAPIKEPVYLTVREAALKLRYSKSSLDYLRHKKKGPPYHKTGGKILYEVHELDEYVKKCKK